MSSDDWPIPWGDIHDTRLSKAGTEVEQGSVADFGLLRIYEQTLYVHADAGDEGPADRDAWLPFDVYVAHAAQAAVIEQGRGER